MATRYKPYIYVYESNTDCKEMPENKDSKTTFLVWVRNHF